MTRMGGLADPKQGRVLHCADTCFTLRRFVQEDDSYESDYDT